LRKNEIISRVRHEYDLEWHPDGEAARLGADKIPDYAYPFVELDDQHGIWNRKPRYGLVVVDDVAVESAPPL
jgi:hypothetical protein